MQGYEYTIDLECIVSSVSSGLDDCYNFTFYMGNVRVNVVDGIPTRQEYACSSWNEENDRVYNAIRSIGGSPVAL